MNKISNIGLFIFTIFATGIIIYSITSAESFGDNYIEELRIADTYKTLSTFSDDIAIDIGKSICNKANNWTDEETSLLSIQNILLQNGIDVKKKNRIIPILRFHSIYELCPENINVLDEIFGNNE
tara:strand:+ start:85 stop:459 length:375 start_codon:yes stop_codon:yes gene_type:complete